ncbi:hypothetical protein LCGC14_0298200 [marine sediment metagenome]|uniref:Uncharacterized protein n=1 Tax=marine sediment metagenome TaxID=412755 RepID=A0A0F9WCM4_9ZZZZ
MEQVKDVDLAELVDSSEGEIFAEKQRSVAGLVKKLLQRQEILAKEVMAAEKSLAKKKEGLFKVEVKITKLRDGDWSVLQEDKPQGQQEN